MPFIRHTNLFEIVDVTPGPECTKLSPDMKWGQHIGKIGFTQCPVAGHSHTTAGGSDCDSIIDYNAIDMWSAAALIMLGTEHELERFKSPYYGNAVHLGGMVYHYLPMCEDGLPDPVHEDVWDQSLQELRAIVRDGFNVLFHYQSQPDWAAPTAARLLSQLGMAPDEAIRAVCTVCPGSIDTSAQANHVFDRGLVCDDMPDTSIEAIADRALGAMLGLALGEAEVRWLETEPRVCEPRVIGSIGAEAIVLQPGEWSSGTAMALALMDSLLINPRLHATDLMNRFAQWHETGHYSCTGTCYDIGEATRNALLRYDMTGNPLSGSVDPLNAGNGSLIRVAPVAIRHWNDRFMLREVAAMQSRITHSAPAAVDACVAFAELLADVIAGCPRSEVMRPRTGGFDRSLDPVLSGVWRGASPREVTASDYVVESLEAALWGVGRTGQFSDALLMVTGSDEEADVQSTGAVVGQLAGALYGASSFSQVWLKRLAWRQRIVSTTRALFERSLP